MTFNSHACLTRTQRITKNCLKLLSTNIETARQIISLMSFVCVCVCVFFFLACCLCRSCIRKRRADNSHIASDRVSKILQGRLINYSVIRVAIEALGV